MAGRSVFNGLRRGRSRAVPVLIAALMSMALVACGDDEEEAAAPQQPANGEQATGGSGEFDGEQAVADYIYGDKAQGEEWMGKPADDELEPVVVAWVNAEGGTFGRPWLTRVTRAGVKMLNERFGGIGGHPIELRECLIGSEEEEGQRCGQEFVNDDEVQLILQGDSATGGAAFQQAVNGKKPILGTVPYGPEFEAENTYMLTGGGLALVSLYTYGRDHFEAKTFGNLVVDTPLTRTISQTLVEAGERIDIKSERVFYPPGATELVGPLAAGNLGEKDVVFAGGTDPGACIAQARALDQLGVKTPTMAMVSCLNDEVKDALGDWPKWHYILYHTNHYDAKPGSPEAAFLSAVREYGDEGDIDEWYAPMAFAQLMVLANVVNEIGPDKLTSETFSEAMADFTGPAYMLPDEIKFGGEPFASVGSAKGRVYEYLGNDKWRENIPRWIEAPGAATQE